MKQYKLAINGNPYSVKILEFAQDTITAEVNGSQHKVAIEEIENLAIFSTESEPKATVTTAHSTAKGSEGEKKNRSPQPAAAAIFGSEHITAPIPGQIIAINVVPGQDVKKGEAVLILEAMKMENIITAKRGGVIGDIEVAVGEAVTQDQLLVTMGNKADTL